MALFHRLWRWGHRRAHPKNRALLLCRGGQAPSVHRGSIPASSEKARRLSFVWHGPLHALHTLHCPRSPVPFPSRHQGHTPGHRPKVRSGDEKVLFFSQKHCRRAASRYGRKSTGVLWTKDRPRRSITVWQMAFPKILPQGSDSLQCPSCLLLPKTGHCPG